MIDEGEVPPPEVNGVKPHPAYTQWQQSKALGVTHRAECQTCRQVGSAEVWCLEGSRLADLHRQDLFKLMAIVLMELESPPN